MSGSASIRKAVVADAEVISVVHVASKQAAYRGLVPAPVLSKLSAPQAHVKRQEMWRKVLANDKVDVFVAELDGQVVGFVSSGLTHDDERLQKATGEIYALYVSPDQQRGGIGRKLTGAALRGLEKRGFSEATLWTALPSARSFYEAVGFRLDGAEKVSPLVPGYFVQVTDVRYPFNLANKAVETDR
ncbi:GNAT family N-acetyltransferase [Nodosilinea sp. LEGE 07088]|uniref:GNAT family N-acetyltransferase n=1 Tax=Nodosilinea sp. LEGE 07088 TaxID=2777968 RepID=UPI00188004AF|nr:GNAT family N-acetyltransferase [Nodosilinea sp. LEGE 07088]MBE9139597.1 GNAT family N-acetyltransferase [Nodosilinea sp. LEGE 07088]